MHLSLDLEMNEFDGSVYEVLKRCAGWCVAGVVTDFASHVHLSLARESSGHGGRLCGSCDCGCGGVRFQRPIFTRTRTTRRVSHPASRKQTFSSLFICLFVTQNFVI
jgi:hypothetical protein